MQVLLLALALGVFAHDAVLGRDAEPLLAGWLVLVVVFVPKLVLMGVYAWACRHVLGRLGKPGSNKTLRRFDRLTNATRSSLLALYAIDLSAGWLIVVRSVADVVLIDEAVAMLPTLLAVVFGWLAYYPVDRRLREATLMRRIDAGLPVYPPVSRGKFVGEHLRHEVSLILLPLLLIMAWSELVTVYFPAMSVAGFDARPGVVMAGAAAVFLLSPTIIRFVWNTQPLPAGEVREEMLRLCKQHNVGVRDILLWKTSTGMINAAVMGIVSPLRFILLSDGLLDQLPRREVEAVMAHELAHVRRHHMVWLILVAIAAIGAAEVVMVSGMIALGLDRRWPEVTAVISVIGAGAVWWAVFGWVSRRMERQADTFAVQHLAANNSEASHDDTGECVIDETSAAAMIDALGRVATLNHMPATRKNWRHGSIAWRQDYLRTLVGRPPDQLAIDRLIGRIKLAAVAGLLLTALGYASL